MTEKAPQRKYELREMFNALRWMVRSGAPWRMMPNHFPPWHAIYDQYDQTQRWIEAGVFEDIADDLRKVMREAAGKKPEPTAAIIDSQTLRSTPESGERAGYDAGKKIKGSKVHIAVDTLGNLLALRVTPANVQDREQVAQIARDIQAVTGKKVEVLYADGGYVAIVERTRRTRRMRQKSRVSVSRLSRFPMQYMASWYCRSGGLWSGPLPGRHGSVVW